MKYNSIINRYIFKEMLLPFFISIAFFTFVFIMTQILELTNLIVNYQVDISIVLLMLIYLMPYFIVFVVPMSVMMTVLLTFLRLSSDNEIVALKTGGFSNFQLIPPVLIFGFIGCIFTGFMIIKGLPWGQQSFKNMISKVAESDFNIGIKEGSFNDIFKNVMLYVERVDPVTKSLNNIFLEEQRSENIISTIVAHNGSILRDKKKHIIQLILTNGTINQVSLKNKTANTIYFDTYEVKLDLGREAIKINKNKSEIEMGLSELWNNIKISNESNPKYYLMKLEFHRKFSIPFACISLGFLAAPLGMQLKTAKRSFGLGIGIIFFLLYYFLLSIGRVYGETGAYPPVIGMWLPNIVTALAGLYLLYKRQ